METLFIQIGWCLGDTASRDKSKPVTSKTKRNCIDANDKIWAFKQVLEFWKICTRSRQVAKTFLDKISGDINQWDFVVAVPWNAWTFGEPA